MRPMTLFLIGLLGLGSAGAQSPGQAPQKIALVELFTSEGCSSCPPADALLKQIDGTMPAGTRIIALSEHVTYWNNLGWRDPWSQELFTDRQRTYGERLGLDGVYTPQVVVNGSRQVLGSDRRAVLAAVTETRAPESMVTIDTLERKGNKLNVSYTLAAGQPRAELWATIAEDAVSSSVLRGENGGRKLTHVSVARNLVNLGEARQGSRMASLDIPEGTPGRHVVLFVQQSGQGRVLAVEARQIQ